MSTTKGYIYILTTEHNTTLYTGVTSDLFSRIYDHKHHKYKNSFTDKYNITKLVYYEEFSRIEDAIHRQTEIKKWRRDKRLTLINEMNPQWNDLWEEVQHGF